LGLIAILLLLPLLLLQAAFHVFGMELLTQLDLAATNDFFKTFFALPGEMGDLESERVRLLLGSKE
jgi:hypothetical protein